MGDTTSTGVLIEETGEGRWVSLNGIAALRLISAWSALRMYVKYGGEFYGKGTVRNSLLIVGEITGETYPNSPKGKRRALDDCIRLLRAVDEADPPEGPPIDYGLTSEEEANR